MNAWWTQIKRDVDIVLIVLIVLKASHTEPVSSCSWWILVCIAVGKFAVEFAVIAIWALVAELRKQLKSG